MSFMGLSVKQNKFIESYLVTNNAKQSALNAGYPEKYSASIGWQLLKNPKILAELDSQRTKLRSTITKESYIDRALSIHDSLDKTEANAPRYYDIAGKALGYIGANQDSRPNQTLIINATLTGKESPQELLANVRRLLQDNSGS